MNIKQLLPLLIVCIVIFFACETKQDKKVETETIAKSQSVTTFLDSLIQVNPKNDQLYYERARYFYDSKLYPRALIDILYAVDLNKKSEKSYLLGGDIYIAMGQGKDAVELMNEAINNNPNSEVLYLRAVEYNYYMQDYKKALNFANDLLRINKNNADAYFFKGLIFKFNDVDKAVSSFQTCVEQDPSYYNAYMQLGILLTSKNNSLAIKYFNNALKLNESSREAIYGKAYLYQQNKEYNKAKKEYKQLIIVNRQDHEAWFNMGHCFLAQDSLLKAQKHFDMAQKSKPDYVDAIFMQGQIAERLGDIPSAKIFYHSALKLLPGNSTIQEALDELK